MKVILKDKNTASSNDQKIEQVDKFTKLHYSAINGKKLVLFRSTEEQQKLDSGYIIRQGFPLGPITLQKNIQQLASPDQKIEFLSEDSVELPEIITEKLTDIPNIDEEPTPVNLRYPLIPKDPKGGKVFAYAHIYFDQKGNELIYNIVEPALDDKTKRLIENIKFYIQEKIDVNFAQVKGRTAEGYVTKLIENALRYFKERSRETVETVKYYVIRDFVGLEIIEPLMQDNNIEDISCDGVNIPIYVYHRDSKIGSIKTNIRFTDRDALDAFVSKVAERCGKSISVARPLLDGTLPNGSRVQATLGSDIARHGSNFTIRMFTENPLTPVDMVKYGTCDLKMMSYFWFLVERGASFLISGGTATGKTSFLNALSLFIKPQMKIISIEDSVTGDSSIVIMRNGKLEKTTISKLIDDQIEAYQSDSLFGKDICSVNPENIKVFSLDKNGKIILSHISSFIRHKTKKKIYRVLTASGREIKVTGDHSLFSLDGNGSITTVKTTNIQPGMHIAVPRILPYCGVDVSFNLIDHLSSLTGLYLAGDINKIPNVYFDSSENKQKIRWWKNHGILPVYAAIKIKNKGFNFRANDFKIRSKGGPSLPCLFEIDDALVELFGLWLAEGCYDTNSVIISNEDQECRDMVTKIGKRFGINIGKHSDNVSLLLNSKALKIVMEKVLGFSGNAYTKYVPSWIFDLPSERIACLLRGYFSGDGHVSKFEIQARSSSIELLKGLQTLLLRYGIISRILKFYEKDKTYGLRISSSKFLKVFYEKITFLQERKHMRLEEISARHVNHDTKDIVPLSTNFLKSIEKEIGGFNTKSYYNGSYMGREALSNTLLKSKMADTVSMLANSDIYWDSVKLIEEVENISGYVYDVSVPETENFVCENIIAHNTAELRLPHSHWVPEVARTPLSEKGAVDMYELLRESLRQRPDYIIVGEVRGKEAFVLFQQMSIGHPGMATIHADSFTKLIDRLTTAPISLAPNLIQNLDVVVFLRSVKIGRRYIRRVVSVVEVLGYDKRTRLPVVAETFKWNPKNDEYTSIKESILLKRTADKIGITNRDVKEDLENRSKVLEWMMKNEMKDYRKVSSIINLFYTSQDFLVEKIREEV